MKTNRWLPFLLSLSLALNLAFLAALIYKRTALKKSAVRPRLEIKNDISNLSSAQAAQVRALVNAFKLNSLQAKENIRDKRVEIIEELGQPACDASTIASLTEELNQMENQLNRDFLAALQKINDILEPSQRLNLLYLMSRNWFFLTPNREKGGSHE